MQVGKKGKKIKKQNEHWGVILEKYKYDQNFMRGFKITLVFTIDNIFFWYVL